MAFNLRARQNPERGLFEPYLHSHDEGFGHIGSVFKAPQGSESMGRVLQPHTLESKDSINRNAHGK